MNASLHPVLAQALVPEAPPQSVVHKIVKAEPLPAVDPLSPELRRQFDHIFLRDRDSERLRHPFPGER